MKNKTLLILAVIIAAAVLLTFVFNAAKREDYENWRSTEGVVTGVSAQRKFRVQVYYDYVVDGEMLSAWESLHIRRSTIPAEGENVSVWYDTEDPSRTSLSKPEVGMLDWIAPVFIVVPLLFAVMLSDKCKSS